MAGYAQAASVPESAPADLWTLGSIGVIAYILGNVLHEGVGHLGACVLTGQTPISVSAVAMECSRDNQFVLAGGTVANFLAGALFFLLGRRTGSRHPHWKYFFWLAMSGNLLSGTGYFLFSGIGGFGDWAGFIQGLEPVWAWRTALAVFGGASYVIALAFLLRELQPFIGLRGRVAVPVAQRLCWTPYLCGGIVECLAGLVNPQGMILVALSAAASTFGGSSGLFWGPYWLPGLQRAPATQPLRIGRSPAWIATAALLAAAFIAILGPGLRLSASMHH